jgi:hypothetical protein
LTNKTEPYQAPVGIENRAVGEPEPIPQAPAEDIQASINYLAGLPKMNIPQIPDIEEIKRKMAEANMNFPEPVSYPDQLQAIRDLPPMTSNAHKRRNTSGNAKYSCTSTSTAPAQYLHQQFKKKIQALSTLYQNQSIPKFSSCPKIQAAIQNIPTPTGFKHANK